MNDGPINTSNRKRPLPLDRHQVIDFEYGVKEPDSVPIGKVTLRNALKFITDHQNNRKINSVENISKEYSIDEETTSI